jgi:hypothetical protein
VQLRVWSCDADRACINYNYAGLIFKNKVRDHNIVHHDAAHGNQKCRCKTPFLHSSKQVTAIVHHADLPISLDSHSVTKIVQDQSLMCFSQTEFPWKTSIFDTASRSSCATIMTRDENVISFGLCNTTSYDANTYF